MTPPGRERPRRSRAKFPPGGAGASGGAADGARRAGSRAVSFHKVHGAGNDFVLVDARGRSRRPLSRAAVRRLLDRRRGVGGDGLLWLADDPRGTSAWARYWNADGGRAAFCGNGARCVAMHLLATAKAAGGRPEPTSGEVVFRLEATTLRGRSAGAGRFAVLVPVPRLLGIPADPPPGTFEGAGPGTRRADGDAVPGEVGDGVEVGGGGGPPPAAPCRVDAGVPHWVIPVADLEAADLAGIAPAIRAWPAFGPAGTNVDLVSWTGDHLLVRTWERGVEGETLACGSGLVAAGAWAVAAGWARFPVRLRSRGGDRFCLRRDAAGRGLWLEGPAAEAFAGSLRV